MKNVCYCCGNKGTLLPYSILNAKINIGMDGGSVIYPKLDILMCSICGEEYEQTPLEDMYDLYCLENNLLKRDELERLCHNKGINEEDIMKKFDVDIYKYFLDKRETKEVKDYLAKI